MSVFPDSEIAALFAPVIGAGKVALAVSGGADSMALMVLAHRAGACMDGCPEFIVLTVDHGLRAEAKHETALVAATARRLGFDCRILTNNNDMPKGNVQAAARELRYGLMCEACHDMGADILVTAHHLEDQAETFLLRLARGSGVDGLGAMAPESWCQGVRLIRPFLDITKARLRGFLESIVPEIDWIEDPSNQDPVYDRVKFRKLAPRLRDAGLTPERLVETARRMREAEKVLEQVADDLALRAVRVDPAGHCSLNRSEFAAAQQDTRLRLLSRCLTAVSGQTYRPRMTRLRNMEEVILSAKTRRRTLAGCVVEIGREQVDIWREPGRQGLAEIKLSPGDTKIWDGRFCVSLAYRTRQSGLRPVTVRALGSDGLQIARRKIKAPIAHPDRAAFARTMVSFWQEGHLLAVPHLRGFPSDFDLNAKFLGAALINPEIGREPGLLMQR